MQSIKEEFRKNRLSEDKTDILIKSWSCGTSKQYSPHILHGDFYSSQNVNPFKASINNGAEFLTQHFLHSRCE